MQKNQFSTHIVIYGSEKLINIEYIENVDTDMWWELRISKKHHSH